MSILIFNENSPLSEYKYQITSAITHAEEWYVWFDIIYHNINFYAADNNYYFFAGLTNRNVSHASFVNDDSVYAGIGGNNTSAPGYLIGYTRIFDGGSFSPDDTATESSSVYQMWDSKATVFFKGSNYCNDVGVYWITGDGKTIDCTNEDTSTTWTADQNMNLFFVAYPNMSNVNITIEIPKIHLLSTDRASNPVNLADLMKYPPPKAPFDYGEAWTYNAYDLADAGWVYV